MTDSKIDIVFTWWAQHAECHCQFCHTTSLTPKRRFFYCIISTSSDFLLETADIQKHDWAAMERLVPKPGPLVDLILVLPSTWCSFGCCQKTCKIIVINMNYYYLNSLIWMKMKSKGGDPTTTRHFFNCFGSPLLSLNTWSMIDIPSIMLLPVALTLNLWQANNSSFLPGSFLYLQTSKY